MPAPSCTVAWADLICDRLPADGTCHAPVLDPGERQPRPCGRPCQHQDATRCNAHEQRACRGVLTLDPIGEGRTDPRAPRTLRAALARVEERVIMAACALVETDSEDDTAWSRAREAFLREVADAAPVLRKARRTP